MAGPIRICCCSAGTIAPLCNSASYLRITLASVDSNVCTGCRFQAAGFYINQQVLAVDGVYDLPYDSLGVYKQRFYTGGYLDANEYRAYVDASTCSSLDREVSWNVLYVEAVVTCATGQVQSVGVHVEDVACATIPCSDTPGYVGGLAGKSVFEYEYDGSTTKSLGDAIDNDNVCTDGDGDPVPANVASGGKVTAVLL